MAVANRTVKTSHGDIAISETAGRRLPLVMIHGNSSCKEVFSKQLESALGDEFHIIALDLPGHGDSSRPVDPVRTYSIPGYADALVELLENLGVSKASVYGWSVGGHIGMEMLARFDGMAGLMISGAPPVAPTMESIQEGFQPSRALALSWQEEWSEEEFQAYTDTIFGQVQDADLREAGRRADGASRRCMAESLMAGRATDERPLVIHSDVPIAVINGANDPIVNLQYIGDIPYENLWDKHCFMLRGVGHLPFREAPEMFNALLGRFMNETEGRATVLSGRKAANTKTHAA